MEGRRPEACALSGRLWTLSEALIMALSVSVDDNAMAVVGRDFLLLGSKVGECLPSVREGWRELELDSGDVGFGGRLWVSWLVDVGDNVERVSTGLRTVTGSSCALDVPGGGNEVRGDRSIWLVSL